MGRYRHKKSIPRKKRIAQISGATLGFIGADVGGAITGWQFGGKLYDMTNGETVRGNSFGLRTIDGPQPFLTIDPPQNLPQNISNMAYSTPASRRTRYSGSSVFRTPGSSFRGSFYGGVRRRRFTRRNRYRYRRKLSRFRGRFRRPRYFKRRKIIKRRALKRKRVNRKNLKPNTLRSKGYEAKVETYGAITDAHCVYLKHSSFHVTHIAQTIAAGLIRKLFKKMGYDIPDFDVVLSGIGPVGPDATKYRLLFSYVDPTSVGASIGIYAFTFGSHDTLNDVAINGSDPYTIYNYLVGYMLDKADVEPLGLELQVSDNSGTPNFITAAKLNLQNEYIYLNCRSTLRLQNRTTAPPGSTGTDTARFTDVVDNQPLSGKVLTFKHGDPRLRYASQPPLIYDLAGAAQTRGDSAQISGVNWSGMDLVRATDLPQKYQEPPNKDHFVNCLSSKKFILNVGSCMQTGLSWKVHGRFTNVLKKFRPQRGTTSYDSLDRVFKIAGKSQIVVMEEYIRTENANTVKVGYEREYVCAASFISKPMSSMSTKFSVDTVRNDP